jgi:sec-independent protein translocase protein TatA
MPGLVAPSKLRFPREITTRASGSGAGRRLSSEGSCEELGRATHQHDPSRVGPGKTPTPKWLASWSPETDVLPLKMNLLASFMNLGGPDLLVILVIILVLFGAKKLPELARGLGQAIKEFQKAKDEFTDEINKAGQNNTASKTNPPPSTVSQNPPSGAQPDSKPADKV